MRPYGIDIAAFIRYKCLNSLFLGLSVGSVFTIYAPLEPSVYSLGGVALAVAMLIIARLYGVLMNRAYFFRISLGVELVILALMLYFLAFSYSYTTALLIYIGYQATFAFGSYLVRAETMLFPKSTLLSALDTAKQKGYLIGMAVAFVFLKALEKLLHVSDAQMQVYAIHILLLLCEVAVIGMLLKAFRTPKSRT